MNTISEQKRRYLFIATWAIATLFFSWRLTQGRYSLESRLDIPNLAVMLLCTVALLIPKKDIIKS